MSSKWVDIFNSKFEELVKDLIEIFPEDKDFKLLKSSFSLLKLADKTKPFELFVSYGGEFDNVILTRDETFFLNHDFENIVGGDRNFTDELMKKLKGYWCTLNDKNKDIIWQYLTLFHQLKKKISI
jgi:hypothetical protein